MTFTTDSSSDTVQIHLLDYKAPPVSYKMILFHVPGEYVILQERHRPILVVPAVLDGRLVYVPSHARHVPACEDL